MQNRLTRNRSHVALQIAQPLDRILDLSRPSLYETAGENADKIARDKSHAMHPYSYRPIGTKAL